MRFTALAFGVLAGCSHAAPPPEVAPKGPTPCEHASDTMVQLLLDRMTDKQHVPTEEADQLRNLIRERCEQDRWSAEATTCLTKMTKLDDAEACSKLMTDEQQAALVRDEQAKFSGPRSGSPATEAAPPPTAPTAPATDGGPAPAPAGTAKPPGEAGD